MQCFIRSRVRKIVKDVVAKFSVIKATT
uniref:Uncharacterized protein n=1 Tax=Anguilla anguilla TaxID=7936 RepID=A0A0E9QX60_ANGAN